MKKSVYKNYADLPLFLNLKIGAPIKTQRSGFDGERPTPLIKGRCPAGTEGIGRSSGMSEPCRFRQGEGYGACDDEAQVLGVSPSSAYELMHEPDFPVLRVGSRMVVPKEKFIQWVEEHTGGAG